MRRRELLGLVGAGVTALAGCTTSGPGGGGSDDTPEPTASPTATPTETPTDSPTDTETPRPEPEPVVVTSESFEIASGECGTGKESSNVSHERTGDGGGTVTVEGVIVGSDACHSARLAGTSGGEERLDVDVETYVPEENEGKACADCVVDIGYRATVAYEGDGPFEVVVDHDGEMVVTAGPFGDS